jgi:hypothetical protein
MIVLVKEPENGELANFERGHIVSVRLGASFVIKTATLLCQEQVPKVMPAASVKRHSGQTSTMTERDH